jgi:hypothetical protein
MKKNLLFFVFAAMFLFAAVSCQKEDVKSANDLELKAKPIIEKAKVSIEASANPAAPGEEVTITVTVDKTCGSLSIQERINGEWVTINDNNVIYNADPLSAEFTYTAGVAGESRTFRARWNPSGCGGQNGGAQFSSTLVVTVEDGDCLSGIYIAATKYVTYTGNVVGDEYTIEATFKVTACQAAYDVKVQGGLVANAFGIDAIDGTAINRNKNTIVNWTGVDFEAGETKDFTVVYKLKIKDNTTDFPISGAWSAKGVDEDGFPLESAYTERLTLSTPLPL